VKEVIVLDTGPIMSYLVPNSQHHAWVVDEWARLDPPLYTCEAVISEAAHRVRRENSGLHPLLELVEIGVIKINFSVQEEITWIARLIAKYRQLPMSVADACLVRMSEFHDSCRVMTTDTDFRIYRRNGRQLIPVLMPDQA